MTEEVLDRTRLKDPLRGSIIDRRERGQVAQTSRHGTEIRTFQKRGQTSGHGTQIRTFTNKKVVFLPKIFCLWVILHKKCP